MRTGRLKARSQFLDIANTGHKAVTKSFVVFCRFDFVETQRPPFQQFDILTGYTVTKKLGNAVVRNRIKRRLRAVMDEILPDASTEFSGAGLVVIGRPSAFESEYKDLCDEGRKVLNWLRKQK